MIFGFWSCHVDVGDGLPVRAAPEVTDDEGEEDAEEGHRDSTSLTSQTSSSTIILPQLQTSSPRKRIPDDE